MATAKKKLGPGRHLQAIKRHRQNEKRYAQNRGARAEVRTVTKKTLQAIASTDKPEAEKLFNRAQSTIAKAVRRGLYHAKTGQRTISRLHRRLSALAS